jgi:hypothetical protein
MFFFYRQSGVGEYRHGGSAFPPTLDFSGRREQAQGLSQFVEVKEFRFAMR